MVLKKALCAGRVRMSRGSEAHTVSDSFSRYTNPRRIITPFREILRQQFENAVPSLQILCPGGPSGRHIHCVLYVYVLHPVPPRLYATIFLLQTEI